MIYRQTGKRYITNYNEFSTIIMHNYMALDKYNLTILILYYKHFIIGLA